MALLEIDSPESSLGMFLVLRSDDKSYYNKFRSIIVPLVLPVSSLEDLRSTAERLNPLLRHATWRINFGFIAPVCWPKESGDAVVEIRCSTPSSNYAEARQLVCVGTYMPGTWHKDCSFYAFRNSSQSERDVIYVTNCKQGLLISTIWTQISLQPQDRSATTASFQPFGIISVQFIERLLLDIEDSEYVKPTSPWFFNIPSFPPIVGANKEKIPFTLPFLSAGKISPNITDYSLLCQPSNRITAAETRQEQQAVRYIISLLPHFLPNGIENNTGPGTIISYNTMNSIWRSKFKEVADNEKWPQAFLYSARLDLQGTFCRTEHNGVKIANLQIQLNSNTYSHVEMSVNQSGRQPPCPEFLANAFNTSTTLRQTVCIVPANYTHNPYKPVIMQQHAKKTKKPSGRKNEL